MSTSRDQPKVNAANQRSSTLPERIRDFVFGSPNSGLATDDEKKAAAAQIRTGYLGLESDTNGVVELLYAEAKSKYDAGRERLKALDTKAGTLTTIITTGFGAFAILGDPAKLSTNPWVVFGLVAFAAAFAFALLVQLPRDVHFPELSRYVSLSMAKDKALTTPLKYELTRSWVRDADSNDRSCAAKARLLNLSTTLVGIGLAALTLNYLLAPTGQKPAPTIRIIIATPAPDVK